MFEWLTQKRMPGGLVFGPPAWMPERVEETFDGPPAARVGNEDDRRPMPANRAELAALLERLGIWRTSDLLPGLIEQLREAADRPLKGVVLNLLPTQPESALGGALSRLALEDLADGLAAIERALTPRRTLIVLDRHDVRGWRLWKRATRRWRDRGGGGAGGGGKRRRPALKLLLNRYPQANPTLLLWALFGKRLPAGALPTTGKKGGWLMADPVSCWALGRYLRTGGAFTDRPVQLFLQGAQPRMVMGRFGESIQEFCQRHHVAADPAAMQVIVSGMLTGRQVDAGAMRIDSRTESITLREPAVIEQPSPCIACGWCVDVCPTGLTPVRLMELGQKLAAATVAGGGRGWTRRLQSNAAREALHCIACGLCTYVCPTRLPLMAETLNLRVRVAATCWGDKHDP